MDLLKELAVAFGVSAARVLMSLFARKGEDDKEPEVTVEPPHPTFTDLEHQRAQMNASIDASKRTAETSRPPPPPRRRP